MVNYFINNEIYFQGKKQPPRKEYIYSNDIMPDEDGLVRVLAYDGNHYTLKPEEILEDNDMNKEKLKEVYGE